MPEIRSAPRLARNFALATAAVLLTAAVLTLAVLQPGSHPQACPGGEDWIVAEPAGVAMADYGSAATPGTVSPGTVSPGAAAGAGGTAARTPGTTSAGTTSADATAAAGVLLLAGCLDTDRLHPIPASTDGRG